MTRSAGESGTGAPGSGRHGGRGTAGLRESRLTLPWNGGSSGWPARCTAPSVVRVMVMIAAALVAAVLNGAGAAVEQRQAAAAPVSAAGRPRLLFLLARQPLWLLG